MMICGCALCAGGGIDSNLGFSATEPLGLTTNKPSYDWDRGGAQIFRTIGDWMPSYPSALTLTYAYRVTADAPIPPAGVTQWIGGLANNMGGFQQFTAAQIDSMEVAVRLIQDVANIKLERVGTGNSGAAAYTDNAQILMGNYTTGAALQAGGYGFYQFNFNGQGQYARAGSVWNNGTLATGQTPTLENGGLLLNIHELLHAIGADHPGDYNVGQTGPLTYATSAVYAQDTYQYSLMSYFAETESGTGANYGGQLPHTPMMHDIAGLQRIYGANMTTRTGDSIYGFGSNTGLDSFTFKDASTQRVFTIWDAGGNDTLNFSGFTGPTTINLLAESFSSGGVRSDGGAMLQNVAIARGVVVENAVGGAGADTIGGNAVANRLTGAGGNDTIDGREGTDYAVFSGQRAGYLIEAQTTGRVVTDQTGGRDGTDTLINIERLQFADGILAFDTAGIAGQVYRLYQAAFARTPDTAGLSHNIKLVDGGLSLQQMSSAFIGSAEFQQKYGTNVTDTAYINAMYRNVLGRDADQGGLDGWQGRLNDGSWTRTTLLIGFSESPENINLLANQIANGIWIV